MLNKINNIASRSFEIKLIGLQRLEDIGSFGQPNKPNTTLNLVQAFLGVLYFN